MGWYSLVQVLYGVPSLLLMIFFLVMFAVGKSFRNSFYRLLQFDLFVNIACYINSWFGIRFMESEVGVVILIWTERWLPGWLTLSNFLLAWYFHMQCASSVLLCTHRLTSVMVLRAEEIWERRYFLAMTTSVLYSCTVMAPVFLGGFAEKITLQDEKLHSELDMGQVSLIYAMNLIFVVIYFSTITSMGVLTVIFIEKAVQVNTRSNTTKVYIRKMTVVTLVNSAMISGNLFFLMTSGITFALNIEVLPEPFMNVIMSFTSDMITLAMPYILLGIDHKVQTALRLRKSTTLVRPSDQT